MKNKFFIEKYWGYVSFLSDFISNIKYGDSNSSKHKIDYIINNSNDILEIALEGWNNDNNYIAISIDDLIEYYPNVKIAWSLKK